MKQKLNIDPITLALVQNRLDHIAINMGWVMIRSARSPIFNQSHDFSCFINSEFILFYEEFISKR
jgi:N-methylhydantoinase B